MSSFKDWVPKTDPSTPPPEHALSWTAEAMGQPVAKVDALPGGLSSAVHRLTFADDSLAVLRRYTLADWLEREPNIPYDEARTLAMLGEAELGVATPALIASDPSGATCDVPAVLMTHVDGAPFIDPVDAYVWAEKLAVCLAGIHRHPAPADLQRYRRWDDPTRPVPSWTQRPDLWLRAKELVGGELPHHTDTFLHRDFHPNNVHWIEEEICAVVDWLGACVGPIAGDLAHCRWNLAVLTRVEIAESFTDHYRALTGYSEDLLAYDLSTILSGPVGPFPTHAWNALGRVDLTPDEVALRVDAWITSLLDDRH